MRRCLILSQKMLDVFLFHGSLFFYKISLDFFPYYSMISNPTVFLRHFSENFCAAEFCINFSIYTFVSPAGKLPVVQGRYLRRKIARIKKSGA